MYYILCTHILIVIIIIIHTNVRLVIWSNQSDFIKLCVLIVILLLQVYWFKLMVQVYNVTTQWCIVMKLTSNYILEKYLYIYIYSWMPNSPSVYLVIT